MLSTDETNAKSSFLNLIDTTFEAFSLNNPN